jgi:hypothetical protein
LNRWYYRWELVVVPREEVEFEAEVIKRRTRNGVKEVRVHYIHYPEKWDRWIPESDLREGKDNN